MDSFEGKCDLNRKFIKILQEVNSVRLSGIELVIEALHCTFETENLTTGWHQHPFFELSIVTQGVMEYGFRRNERIILKEADNLIFIPPNLDHIRSVIHAPSIILGFQLQIKALTPTFKPFVKSMDSILKNNNYRFKASDELRKIMNNLFEELSEEKPLYISKAELLLKDYLLCFFRDNFYSSIESCERNTKSSIPKHDYYEYITMQAERFIDENCGRQVFVDEIAAFCGVSKRHLNRIFSNTKGSSLGDYMINKKIDSARAKLALNNSLVKDVAYELGFSNTAYFCRFFKKITGKTPEEYRKNR